MPMPWERDWGVKPVSPPSDDEVGAYIVEAARKRNIPEQDALDVWAGEGKGAWQSNFVKRGKREKSYGPYQLYTEGGLGNAFQESTGKDPSDPSTWKEGVDFALDHAKKEGWGAWYGAPARLRGVKYASAEPMRLGPAESSKPWERQWKKPEASIPAAEAVSPAPAGDFSMESQWQEPKPPVTAGGLAKAGASGLQRGIAQLIGMPGDIRSYATKLGVPENMPLSPLLPAGAPTSEQVQGAYDAMGGPTHKPENTAEEFAATVGEFAPAALGGAGGVLRRGAQAVVPGLLSEAGGQVGRQFSPQAEQMGRIAGGVYGGLKTAGKRLPKGPTSSDELRELSQDNYKLAEQSGLEIRGDSFFNFMQALGKDKVLQGLTFNPKLHPRLSGMVEEIEGLVAGPPKQGAMQAMTGVTKSWNPAPISLEKFDNLRRNVLSAARSADPDERRIAGHVINRLDDYFDGLKTGDVAAGDPRLAGAAMRDARDLWRRYRKTEEIEKIIEVAKDRAGQFSLSGSQNAIATGFRQLSKKITQDARVAKRFTDEEKKLIRQLSRRTTLTTFLTTLGKLSPRGALSLIAGAGGAYGENLGPAWVIGEGARMAGGALARGKAGQLRRLAAGGGVRQPMAAGVPLIAGAQAYRPDDQ